MAIKTKCPFWKYAKGKTIICENHTIIKKQYKDLEEATKVKDNFCNTMKHTSCEVYKILYEQD